MLTWIEPGQPLPPARVALREPNGLLAAGRDLSARRLLEAYGKGIFPWYTQGQPVLWWSPDPRMVAFVDEFAPSRSLRRTLRRVARTGEWSFTFDSAFVAVMQACAEPRNGQAGTWITPDIVAAYHGLHRRGHAHSVEVRERVSNRPTKPAATIMPSHCRAFGSWRANANAAMQRQAK